jgi:release factor glutamine methyltransferase
MKSLRKRVFYDDLVFQVFKDVYEPAEDTFLIADSLAQIVRDDDTLLDIGTGCGMVAIIAAKKAKHVIATDVNPHAVNCARLNAKINGVASKVDVRLGDLFHPIGKTERFDVVVFNAPYLPSSPNEQRTWIGRAWAGGSTGRQLIDRFIMEAPYYLKRKGKILLVQSSLANVDETLKRFLGAGLEAQVISEKKVSFETIVVIQASHLFKRRIKNLTGETL